jgi:hypothetical protein
MRVILFGCFVLALIHFGQLLASDALMLVAGICFGAFYSWLRDKEVKQ